ncbi:hypothetical protein [Streptomyces rubiginosohelvolus]|uniref:hypothetical protein n=1 Tax=Streptomyces rubiginosohelvolus TaxID=67362 RepID=UPI0035D8D654
MAQVEGLGQVIASALLLACGGRKTAAYTNLRHKNATELITAAQQEPGLHGLLDGLDNDLSTGRASPRAGVGGKVTCSSPSDGLSTSASDVFLPPKLLAAHFLRWASSTTVILRTRSPAE